MVDAKRGKNLYERVTVGLGFTFRLDDKVATSFSQSLRLVTKNKSNCELLSTKKNAPFQLTFSAVFVSRERISTAQLNRKLM